MGQTEHKNIKIRSRKDLEAIRERTRPLLEVERGARIVVGMGTCGLVGQIGVYTGWVSDIAAGVKSAITLADWTALLMISFVLPAVLTWLIAQPLRRIGWIAPGDLKLD